MWIHDKFGSRWIEPSCKHSVAEEKWGEEDIANLQDPGAFHYVMTRLEILLYEAWLYGRRQ